MGKPGDPVRASGAWKQKMARKKEGEMPEGEGRGKGKPRDSEHFLLASMSHRTTQQGRGHHSSVTDEEHGLK